MLHNFGIHAQGREHGGYAKCHVLQPLASALPASPCIIGKGHDADVEFLQFLHFASGCPTDAADTYLWMGITGITYDLEPNATALALSNAQQRGFSQPEMGNGGNAARPAYHHGSAFVGADGGVVNTEVNGGGDHYSVLLVPAGVCGEIFIACDYEVRHGSQFAQLGGPLEEAKEPVVATGLGKPDGIIEVKNHTGTAAGYAALHKSAAGHEGLAENEHGIIVTYFA